MYAYHIRVIEVAYTNATEKRPIIRDFPMVHLERQLKLREGIIANLLSFVGIIRATLSLLLISKSRFA